MRRLTKKERESFKHCRVDLFTRINRCEHSFSSCPLHLKITWRFGTETLIFGAVILDGDGNVLSRRDFPKPYHCQVGDTFCINFEKMLVMDRQPEFLANCLGDRRAELTIELP